MNTLLNHFRESWKEPHNGTGYISSINLKVDLSLNTKWILYQKSNENHAHCKCLRNTDHFRDGLVCAFELFALYLFIYLFIWVLYFWRGSDFLSLEKSEKNVVSYTEVSSLVKQFDTIFAYGSHSLHSSLGDFD